MPARWLGNRDGRQLVHGAAERLAAMPARWLGNRDQEAADGSFGDEASQCLLDGLEIETFAGGDFITPGAPTSQCLLDGLEIETRPYEGVLINMQESRNACSMAWKSRQFLHDFVGKRPRVAMPARWFENRDAVAPG